ncbi:MAG: restriction endonuclease subunit M, partial [Kiritimatiellae bacterium]|nr:restriction endonuclease subunit M [Kiritimatiellia bacterium]
RAAYKRGDCEWWKFTWPLHEEHYNRHRIICPYLASSNRFALDTNKEYLSLTDTTVLFENKQQESLLYLLGLLNSRLLTFRFRSIGKLKGGSIYEYFWNSISKLPIRRINFSDPADKARHDKMVALVDHMLDLHKKQATAKTDHERTLLERQISATDREIDLLVYELYGLTASEITIVEGAVK